MSGAWTTKLCKSGEVLYHYNTETGEWRWPKIGVGGNITFKDLCNDCVVKVEVNKDTFDTMMLHKATQNQEEDRIPAHVEAHLIMPDSGNHDSNTNLNQHVHFVIPNECLSISCKEVTSTNLQHKKDAAGIFCPEENCHDQIPFTHAKPSSPQPYIYTSSDSHTAVQCMSAQCNASNSTSQHLLQVSTDGKTNLNTEHLTQRNNLSDTNSMLRPKSLSSSVSISAISNKCEKSIKQTIVSKAPSYVNYLPQYKETYQTELSPNRNERLQHKTNIVARNFPETIFTENIETVSKCVTNHAIDRVTFSKRMPAKMSKNVEEVTETSLSTDKAQQSALDCDNEDSNVLLLTPSTKSTVASQLQQDSMKSPTTDYGNNLSQDSRDKPITGSYDLSQDSRDKPITGGYDLSQDSRDKPITEGNDLSQDSRDKPITGVSETNEDSAKPPKLSFSTAGRQQMISISSPVCHSTVRSDIEERNREGHFYVVNHGAQSVADQRNTSNTSRSSCTYASILRERRRTTKMLEAQKAMSFIQYLSEFKAPVNRQIVSGMTPACQSQESAQGVLPPVRKQTLQCVEQTPQNTTITSFTPTENGVLTSPRTPNVQELNSISQVIPISRNENSRQMNPSSTQSWRDRNTKPSEKANTTANNVNYIISTAANSLNCTTSARPNGLNCNTSITVDSVDCNTNTAANCVDCVTSTTVNSVDCNTNTAANCVDCVTSTTANSVDCNTNTAAISVDCKTNTAAISVDCNTSTEAKSVDCDTNTIANSVGCSTKTIVNSLNCKTNTVANSVDYNTSPTANSVSCNTNPTANSVSCNTNPTAHSVSCNTNPTANSVSCNTNPTANSVSCNTNPTANSVSCNTNPTANSVSCNTNPTANSVSCNTNPTANSVSCNTYPTAHSVSRNTNPTAHSVSCNTNIYNIDGCPQVQMSMQEKRTLSFLEYLVLYNAQQNDDKSITQLKPLNNIVVSSMNEIQKGEIVISRGNESPVSVNIDMSQEKPFSCPDCGKRFKHRRGVSMHCHSKMCTTGLKPHKCRHCDKSFGRLFKLRIHERSHTGERPYKCDQCVKRFSCRKNLRTHFRTHTGEKPYKCTHCDKSFTQKSSQLRHIRIHTGAKPYTCKRCKKAFNQSSSLARHLLQVHADEEECDTISLSP